MSYENKFMAGIIYKSNIEKRLVGDKLNKVGNIRIYDDKGGAKTYHGVELKKFISKLGGKTGTRIEKDLREKYRVSGYQLDKRHKLMELIKGGEGVKGLTPKQTEQREKRNIRASKASAILANKYEQGMQKSTDRSVMGRRGFRYTKGREILGEVGKKIKGTTARGFAGTSQGQGPVTSIAEKIEAKNPGKILPPNINKLGGQPPIIKLAA